MPTQDSYDPLSVADANTFATGFRKDPATGILTTYKIPVPFLYGGKWTVGVGVPTTPGVGPGDQYLNVSNGDTYTWDNDLQTWGTPTGTLINGSYQFPIWIASKPLASEKLYSFAAPTPFIFETGMGDSLASADAAATSNTVFSLQKNGVEFGTVTFLAGQSSALIACPAAAAFLDGDIFEVLAPAVQDATLSNIRMSLVAIRPSGAAVSDIISSGEAAASAAAAAASAAAAAGSNTAAGAAASASATNASNASNSANSAAGSATTATQKAADAAGSATAASGSASAASSSAGAASTSATNAATSAANAHTSEVNAAASAATVADALQYFSGRNLLINARGEFCARGSSVVVASSQVKFGGPDRWRVVLSPGPGGSCTQSQSSMVGPDGVTRAAIRQTVTTVGTTFTGLNIWQGLHQLIEASRAYKTLGQTITVSGLFRASLAGTYTVSLRTTDGSAYLQTITAAANTVTPYSFQVAVPLSAAIPNTPGVWGLIVNIGPYNAGGLMTSTTGSWVPAVSGNAQIVASGSTAWPTTAGAWIEVTDAQIEVGDRQTPFEVIDWAQTLTDCRRFYVIVPIIRFWGYAGAAGVSCGAAMPFPTAMCKNPTLASAGTISYGNCSGLTFDTLSSWGIAYYCNAAAAGGVAYISTNAAFDAEL